jgi:hypothetical protein
MRRARFFIEDDACRPGEILTPITSCKPDDAARKAALPILIHEEKNREIHLFGILRQRQIRRHE